MFNRKTGRLSVRWLRVRSTVALAGDITLEVSKLTNNGRVNLLGTGNGLVPAPGSEIVNNADINDTRDN
jgi:hypothetical protein